MCRRHESEEVDVEADRAERSYLVLDLGRDRLRATRSEHDVDRRPGRHRDAQPPFVHHDPPPGATVEAVRSTKPSWQGVLVPLAAGTNKTETLWQLCPVAQRTAEEAAKPVFALRVVDHPGPKLEGGAVTDMLGVAAGKLGDPVARVVAVKADDRSLHCVKPTRGASGSTVAAASLRPLAVGAALERRARPLAVLARS